MVVPVHAMNRISFIFIIQIETTKDVDCVVKHYALRNARIRRDTQYASTKTELSTRYTQKNERKFKT